MPGVPAVLLANHGVLVFHRTPELAIMVGGIVEEAAQAGINAADLGGPVEIEEDMRAAALQRAWPSPTAAPTCLGRPGPPSPACPALTAG